MIGRALRQLGSVRGLITVPGALALTLWATAFIALRLDRVLAQSDAIELYLVLQTDYETAVTILSTIAGAAITTLSLVYSLVLVVFTLAAGNIAPRLLRRFTGDRVNQVTAGVLGGTFLFSLTILHQTGPNSVPGVSIAIAFCLAVIAVLQLIFFVHTVSRSVTIDEEIAAISAQLEERLTGIVADNDDEFRDTSFDRGDAPAFEITAADNGYIVGIDEKRLTALADQFDVRVEITDKPGTFILRGQALAGIVGDDGDDRREAIEDAFAGSVTLAPVRGSVDDIEYAISVLLEIALRALSPGVNDTFTAIACVDRLSAAFVTPVYKGLRNRLICDRDGIVRVSIPGLTVEDIVNTAFHPLRRAAAGNLLMLQNIADALIRLHDIADEEVEPIFEHHADLLMASFERTDPMDADRDFLTERLAPILGRDDTTG
ncbi:MAG: DUF2254 domain-containing protein [Roseitalea sp.]|nr:DUF2254 domain-containing protein [Roseitalea sp.]MBO6720723.1 DUF2254 domain-containing protein [Roseitalea sp.]MBO6743870.1 DUF2254 domain-containing protein [Roseitalea sp.]